jgi:antitoxin component HigA of HigAB toxin-antitoxin module
MTFSGTVVSDIDLPATAPAWHSFQNCTPVELCTIKTRRPYRATVNFLDDLVDEIGDRESHALMGLLDIVSLFVHGYEDRGSEFPNSEPHAALRFCMEQHNLRQAYLANILGSFECPGCFKRQVGNSHVSSQHPSSNRDVPRHRHSSTPSELPTQDIGPAHPQRQ